jgi:hypothetical protein
MGTGSRKQRRPLTCYVRASLSEVRRRMEADTRDATTYQAVAEREFLLFIVVVYYSFHLSFLGRVQ